MNADEPQYDEIVLYIMNLLFDKVIVHKSLFW